MFLLPTHPVGVHDGWLPQHIETTKSNSMARRVSSLVPNVVASKRCAVIGKPPDDDVTDVSGKRVADVVFQPRDTQWSGHRCSERVSYSSFRSLLLLFANRAQLSVGERRRRVANWSAISPKTAAEYRYPDWQR
jgi:hypothetical protein